MFHPLHGGIGDNDHADSETDTAIPDDDDDNASFASQPTAPLQPSSFQSVAAWPPGMRFASFFFLMFPGDLQFDPLSSKTTVGSWLVIEDMFAFEWAIYRRCFPAQPPLTARQRVQQAKIRSPPARPRSPPPLSRPTVHTFPLQVLDLARRWSEREDNDIPHLRRPAPGCRSPRSLSKWIPRELKFHDMPAHRPIC